MRERRQTPLLSVLALTFVALLISPIAALAASGLPATVTMDPGSAGPGASVQVTGLDFPANQTVELQLTTTAGPVHLATVTTVDGGFFREQITLPADAPAGYWELRATGPDGSVAVHLFESDATASTVLSEVAPVASAEVAGGGNSIGDIVVMLVFALLIAAVGGAIGYVYLQSKATGAQPGMSAGADPIWSGAAADGDADDTATADEPAWSTPPAPNTSTAHSKT